MNTLFVTYMDIKDQPIGGVKATIGNHKLMSSFGNVFIKLIKKRSNFHSLLSCLQGRFPPMLINDEQKIMALIEEKDIDTVFLNASFMGQLAQKISRTHPNIRLINFFHNCEYDYVNVRFCNTRTWRKPIYRLLAKREEKASSAVATHNIMLTNRDKERVQSLYSCKNCTVIPLAIDDIFVEGEVIINSEEKSVLMLGPAMDANLEGFLWFAKNVSPHLNARTLIVGRGFEKYKEEVESISGNISVFGFVESVVDLYHSVNAVVVPLLSGGGMKIKTAEAIMFGKKVFGTREAFVGFELKVEEFGVICSTPDEFIDKINRFLSEEKPTYSSTIRDIFLTHYSSDAAREAYVRLLGL